jgi:maleate cis-trans isomerase
VERHEWTRRDLRGLHRCARISIHLVSIECQEFCDERFIRSVEEAKAIASALARKLLQQVGFASWNSILVETRAEAADSTKVANLIGEPYAQPHDGMGTHRPRRPSEKAGAHLARPS